MTATASGEPEPAPPGPLDPAGGVRLRALDRVDLDCLAALRSADAAPALRQHAAILTLRPDPPLRRITLHPSAMLPPAWALRFL